MDIVKPYSRRSIFVILVCMVFLAAAFTTVVYFGKTYLLSQDLSKMVTPDVSPKDLISQVAQQLDTYAIYLAFIFAGVSILCGIVLWLLLKNIAKGVLSSAVAPKSSSKQSAAAPAEKKDDRQALRNQRLFLHLLGVLQREGRFVDFLQEDIAMYEDNQIGAAVRNIHSSCRKVINKNLPIKPIAEGSEGEQITVEKGFDPDAIKLTGRVTGEPPFKGIIRHKGWRAQKLELPDLSAIQDPTIISPAEVEIE